MFESQWVHKMIKIQIIEDTVVKETTDFKYQNKRDEIIKEINSNNIINDFSYKEKSTEEKELLRRLKSTSSKVFTKKLNSFHKLKK